MMQLFGDLAVRYQSEIDMHDAAVCGCERTELRVKMTASGGPMCKAQCLDCGAPVGNAVPKQPDLPNWDHELQPAYLAVRKEARSKIQRKFIRLQVQKDDELAVKSNDWRAEYEAYRRTRAWQSKRSKVMRRANVVCEGCLDAPATVVHHTTYANVGDELLFQLVALCRDCHAKAHPEHNEPEFYDNDYLPCFQCRWGGDGIQCGRFEVSTYEALEAGGECGPGFGAFEGLK
ncbi:HNH endonuclease [Yoonia sp. 2307UL14-13]|uniref:HNH endonuclease n=1 Tax=Yoonia sp. 2307UL14-13 TaxID=3126506 RepID=UPI0030EB4B09